ncbi:MAG TPA: isocitrate/isopropylmalate dehydrogenase family protein [Actinomycetota bacterium]|nr:isocitrate/isopropylmalate dehydrogenase family protein [Actinomycetota bacterium]
MALRVTLIPGDGIGPEVARAARLVVEAVGVEVEWDVQEAGAAVVEREGTPLPERVLASIRETRTALKGPITTPVGTGFRSVNVALRQELDLFAAVRPAAALPGVPTRHPNVDLVVIRENTEDLYAGIEFVAASHQLERLRTLVRELAGYEIPWDAGVTVKPISVTGTRRIVRFAFDYARRHGRSKVTVGHKANIMRFSDGVFLATAVEEARSQSDLAFQEVQVDELALRLVTEPEDLDVLLLPNLYGDILSDLCAGLVGGLGLAPGANLGWEYAVFEPVHGSAPDIAGRGLANPVAMILSAAMMLAHLGRHQAARAVQEGVRRVLAEGRVRTPDLGGRSSTMEVAEAVARAATEAAAAPARLSAGPPPPDREASWGPVSSRAPRGGRSSPGGAPRPRPGCAG